MIHYVDNFLPQDQFEALAKRVNNGLRGDISSLKKDGDEPVRVTHHERSGDWGEGCNFLGQECRPAIEKMIRVMEDDLNIKELKNWSIWFQYIIDTMWIAPHQDQGLRFSDQANTFTTVLYTSDWQPGWGGEFIVGEPVYDYDEQPNSEVYQRATGLTNLTHVIEPLPNRMLIWSREEWHGVNPVTNPDPDYLRSFFGTGWSSVKVNDHETFTAFQAGPHLNIKYEKNPQMGN